MGITQVNQFLHLFAAFFLSSLTNRVGYNIKVRFKMVKICPKMPKVTYLPNMGIQFGLNESSEFALVTQKILLLEMNSLHMIVKPISLT
jgi:hypothetical protein